MNNFGIALLLAGFIMLIIALAQSLKNRAFKNAQRVTGTVTRKERPRKLNDREIYVYELMLSYTVDGIDYERTVSVLRDEHEAADVGGEYEILYQPNNPKKIMRPGATNSRNTRITLIIGIVLTAAGVVLLMTGIM